MVISALLESWQSQVPKPSHTASVLVPVMHSSEPVTSERTAREMGRKAEPSVKQAVPWNGRACKHRKGALQGPAKLGP